MTLAQASESAETFRAWMQELARKAREEALKEVAAVCERERLAAVSHGEQSQINAWQEAFTRDAECYEEMRDEILALLNPSRDGGE